MFILWVGFEELIIDEWVGDRKGGRRHNRGNWVMAGRDRCTGHIVRRLLSAMPLKEEEASCRNDASLRYPWGLACSEFPQCLHILAIRLIRFFHNVGLDRYICDTVWYAHCRKIIKFRLLKKVSLPIYGIGFGANFKAGNTNDHMYCLYFFCKGQISVYLTWHSVLICTGNDKKKKKHWNFQKYKIYMIYVF